MATRKGKSPALSNQSEKSFEVLKELNAKLCVELTAEQNALKELRREKAQTVKHIQEHEQNKYNIALKDLKAKLHTGKLRELELQKEALLRKNEFDLQKVTKQRDLELGKLQGDLRRYQDELRDVNKRGLSGTARGTFEAERTRMLREVQELRKGRKTLEDSMHSAQESEKQKSFELRKLEEEKNSLLAKQKKEYDVEIRKLLDEIRRKTRTISQLQQDLGSTSENVTKLQHEKKEVQDALNVSKEVAGLRDKLATARNSKSGMVATLTLPTLQAYDVQVLGSNNQANNVMTDSNKHQDRVDNNSLQQQKVTDLLNKLNEQCTSLSQEKQEVQRRFHDLGKKHRVSQERNRLFHDKNMQLSSCNRRLEERVKQLLEDNASLGSQLEKIQQNQDRLEEQLGCQQTDREAYQEMLEEVVTLKQAAETQSKRLVTLEKSCVEKDRRIELMAHRQKKQSMCSTGQEEKLSLEEYEKNYERFAREHLELERRFALLQNGQCLTNDNGNSDMENSKDWLAEKDELNNRVKLLKDKLGQKAEAYTQLQLRQEELEEHTETLEFRLLELQDNDEKCQTNERYSQTGADLGVPRRHQSSQTNTDLSNRVHQLESETNTLRESLAQYQASDNFLADKNVSLMEKMDALRAENQALVDDYELLKYTVLKLTSQVQPKTEDGEEAKRGEIRERSSAAERREVEEELERVLGSLRTKDEEKETVVKRLQKMLEGSEAKVAEERRESEQKSREVSALREKVQQLEGSVSSPHDSTTPSDEVPVSKEVQRVVLPAELQAELQDLAELKYQVKQLEEVKKTLNNRVQELQSTAGEERQKSDDLTDRVRALQFTNKALDDQVQQLTQHSTKDLQNSIRQLDGQEQSLQAKIQELETELTTTRTKEEKTREALDELKEEKTQRVESLQEQLAHMQENEIRLSETIVELEELEEDLRRQIKDSKQTEDASVDEALVSKLKASEQNLKDQVEQMQHNEKLLKERLSEMEDHQQKDKIRELEDKVKELSDKEASLLEDVYQMKLENQELQEHIDELLADAEDQSEKSDAYSPRASNKSEIIQQLNDTVSQLRDDNSDLKDQLLRSKLDAMETIRESGEFPEGVETVKELTERLQQLEERVKDQEKEAAELTDKVKEMEEGEQKLKADLLEKESKEGRLLKKMDFLEQSEEKLMQQVDVLYESEAKYKEEIQTLGSTKEEAGTRTLELETQEKQLSAKVTELEEAKQKLEAEAKQGKSGSKELKQLRQKVDILLDTEEKLLDRLQQQELVERELHKELEQSEEEVEQLEKENEELEKKLASAEKEAKDLEEALKTQQTTSEDAAAEARVEELEQSKKALETQVEELEESKAELLTKITDTEDKARILEDSLQKLTASSNEEESAKSRSRELEHAKDTMETRIKQLEESETDFETRLMASEKVNEHLTKSENSLCQQITVLKEIDADHTLKVAEHDQMVDGLEKRNKALMDVISTLKMAASQKHNNLEESHTEKKDQQKDNSKVPSNGRSVPMIMPPESLLMETLPPYTPLEPNQLDRMSREEMMSKILELEQMEKFHRTKIGELSGNLGTLRQAVEVVAITMETDADIPVISVRPKGKDWDYESKVQDLVKTEVVLKLKVLELQKKEAILRSQLQEAELTLKEQEVDFKEELDILEDEIHKLRKSEARLKNQRKYGAPGIPESAALARIQELDAMVHDLQASEAKLKRQCQELQRTQVDLHSRLDQAENLPLVDHLGNLRSVENKDKYYSLLQELKELEYSEKVLKSKLTDAEKEEGAKGELAGKIAELERTERGLKHRLELLESQDAGFLEEEMMILDSPEAILQHRIREMEKMEKHLKNQVVELERDREQLHEIARKDKVHIHELTVQLRQLQLSEKNLRQQLHSVETKETHLNMKVDDLTDHIEQLEDTIKALEASERCLKVRLHKQVYNEEDLNFKLETTKEDAISAETKLKKKVTEIEDDRRSLKKKNDELVDQIADLEAGRFSLEQKIRQSEKHNKERNEQITGLQTKNLDSQKRVAELETLNETLADKNHKLQEDKSSLVFEVAHQEQKLEQQVQMQKKLEVLKNQLSEEGGKKSGLQQRLDELAAKEVHSQEKLKTQEKTQWELREKIAELKITVEQLQLQLASASKDKDIETGSVQEKASFTVLSRGVQVRMTDAFTLRQLSPEFKNALKNLGVRHPRAYQQFVRDLQPTDLHISTARVENAPEFVPGNDAPSTPRIAQEGIILPSHKGDEKAIRGTTRDSDQKLGRKPHPPHPLDGATGPQRQQMICELVDNLPTASVGMVTDGSGEDQHWRTVEERRSEDGDGEQELGEEYWTRLENNIGDTDDLALTVNVYDSDDEAEVAPVRRPLSARSTASQTSTIPPPLPTSAPPARPPGAGHDSADEISDIEEDASSLPPLPKSFKYNNQLRAKSADRDSDFSEGTWTHSGRGHHGGRHMRSATSLDSITDSGMCQEEDVKILKERILYLEALLQKKQTATVDFTQEDRAATLKAEVESKQKHQQLQQEYNSLKASYSELVSKCSHLESTRRDKQTLEKIILKLRAQLKGFERTELQKKELEKKLQALEAELKTKAKTESQLVQENAKMKHHIDGLKRKRQEDLQEDFDYVESISFSSPEVSRWSPDTRSHSKIPRRVQSPTDDLPSHSLASGAQGDQDSPMPAEKDTDFVLSPPQLSYAPVTDVELNTNNNNVKGAARSLLPVYQHWPQQERQHWIATVSEAGNGTIDDSWRMVGAGQQLADGAVPIPRLRVQSPELPLTVYAGHPEPPSNLHVERLVGHHSLLLAWCIPHLDEMTRSNGAVVKGYKIYIDSQDKRLVSSPYLTRALIERLNLHLPHTFSIQTVADNGRVSRVVNTAFDDIIPERHSVVSDSGTDIIGDGDQSSVVCSSHCSDVEQRVFLAIYDYDASSTSPPASQQSPSVLTFKTGDMVVTYGNIRPDGYYFAKVHGKKGLVPANFIEEVALLRSPDLRSGSSSVVSYTRASSVASSGRASGEKSRPHGHSPRHHHHHRHNKLSTAQV